MWAWPPLGGSERFGDELSYLGASGLIRRRPPLLEEACYIWERRVLGRAKPSLVPSCEGDDHLSGRIVTDRLKQPTRIPAGAGRPRFTCVNGILLGLAPDEVYRATPVTRCAVSSYLAISPLPRRAETLRGGLLSVALSVVFPRLDVIQHPALWCPDF